MPGRVEQMAAMRSLIERADAGPRTVVVVGGPGSGKSTVLMAVEELAVARGHRSLRCIGLPGASYADGAGLHQLIHAERDRIDRLEPRLAAALLSVFGETPAPADRQLVLLATVRLLQLVASDCPLLVAVDDLQWLDDLSRDCLLSLPAQLGSASVLLVMTVRPGPA